MVRCTSSSKGQISSECSSWCKFSLMCTCIFQHIVLAVKLSIAAITIITGQSQRQPQLEQMHISEKGSECGSGKQAHPRSDYSAGTEFLIDLSSSQANTCVTHMHRIEVLYVKQSPPSTERLHRQPTQGGSSRA